MKPRRPGYGTQPLQYGRTAEERREHRKRKSAAETATRAANRKRAKEMRGDGD